MVGSEGFESRKLRDNFHMLILANRK